MAEAFITLATSDAYCMGCLVVGKCLRKHGTTRKLVVMVSPNLSKAACSSLQEVFDEVIMVDVLDSRDRTHLSWLGRPELGVTFTKLHCWTLTHYAKCVFLDADTLVLCNVDELFDREELSAAPDPGWPDCFNSGVFVFTPSLQTHSRLLDHANIHGSFDGGDQGLLNSFFSDWAIKDINKHLPFIYNLSATAIYTYVPAFQRFGHQAKIVHFLGATKPWHLPFNPRPSNESDFYQNSEQFVNLWWTEYYSQTGMNVQEPQDPQDSVFCEHKLQIPVSHPTAVHPQEQVLDEEPPSQMFSDLSLHASNSSTNQQQETPNPEPMSTDHTVELKPSDFQELQFVQEQENCEAEETENQSPPSAEVQSDMASGGHSEDSSEDRRRWEEGHIDYLGKDAFENIRVKLDQFLQQ